MQFSTLLLLVGVTCQVELAQLPGRDAAPVSERQEVSPDKLWGGTLPDESLRRAAPASGLIQTERELESLWTAWRAGEEVPKVDFERQIVLVGTIDGPNRMFAALTKGKRGDLRANFGGTRIAGPGFGYVIVLVSSKGIDSVNGQPLKPANQPTPPRDPSPSEGTEREFVRVTVQGLLRTGLVAIGGETTGTTIEANGMTFELEIQNPRLKQRAGQFDGELVRVSGRLSLRKSVERGSRWIIGVSSLSAAPPLKPTGQGNPPVTNSESND